MHGSFKVIPSKVSDDFGTNRKCVCNFLLDIRRNLDPTFTVSEIWRLIGRKLPKNFPPLSDVPFGSSRTERKLLVSKDYTFVFVS